MAGVTFGDVDECDTVVHNLHPADFNQANWQNLRALPASSAGLEVGPARQVVDELASRGSTTWVIARLGHY